MKIRIAESIRIEEQLSSKVENTTEALRKVQSEINDFTALRSFGGETSDSIRSYFGEVHLPLIKSLIQAGEGLDQAYKKMVQRFNAQVDSSSHAVIRSEHLDEVRKDLQRLKSRFDQIHHQLSADVRSARDISSFHVPSAARMDEAVERQEHAVNRLKDHFSTFGSADYARNITPLLSAIGHAMSKIKKDYSPHLGEDSFYVAGSFARSDIGEELVRRTEAIAHQNANSIDNGPSNSSETAKVIAKWGITISSLGVKIVPAGLAGMKGFRITRDGDYINIKGRKKWIELYLDRKGKDVIDSFNTNVRRVRAFGVRGMSASTMELAHASSDVKNYLLNKSKAHRVKTKFKIFNSGFKNYLRSPFDFVKRESWERVGNFGKIGKAAGVFGAGLTLYSDITAHKNEKWSGDKVANIAGDVTVDLGSSAAAAGAGALAGSFFLPPLGTVVGTGVGFGISMFTNADIFQGKSAVDWAKTGIHKLSQGVASWFR